MGEIPIRDNKGKRIPEYRAWQSMKYRCSKSAKGESKRNYYDRGIRVCKEWLKSFDCFYTDMGPKPNDSMSLDRVDNDKGYYKGNCRWASKSEQSSNQRHFRVYIDGKHVKSFSTENERYQYLKENNCV